MRKPILLFIIFLFATSTAWAMEGDVYQQLDEALMSGRVRHDGFDRAYKELKPLAEHGDAKAMFHMSILYYLGVGGAQRDEGKARQLVIDSAEKGYARAQYQLADNYERGVYGDRDDKAALNWYTRAANGGMCAAMIRLASAYENGDLGLVKDAAKTAEWNEKAKTCVS